MFEIQKPSGKVRKCNMQFYIYWGFLLQKFKGLFKPNEQWGPKNSRTKLEWIKSVTEREMDEVLSK